MADPASISACVAVSIRPARASVADVVPTRGTFPLPVPVLTVADVPSPRVVRAVEASMSSINVLANGVAEPTRTKLVPSILKSKEFYAEAENNILLLDGSVVEAKKRTFVAGNNVVITGSAEQRSYESSGTFGG